jgi:RNA-directed DNA polymerase
MLNERNLLESWRYLNKDSAYGVDRISAKDYEAKLVENVKDLVARLKRKGYHAKLLKRKYILKSNGKKRPLGIPATEDKLLQLASARILSSIYEKDFMPYSYGYRKGRDVKKAIKSLHYELQYGWYGYIVEADIKGFFENLNHDWLIRMLEERVNDKAFLRLIKKWLNAGILEPDKMIVHPATGTPQGGVISPVLGNIYLHYVLDLWFEKVIKRKCEGRVYLSRYADDFVCLFQYRRDAEMFYRSLPGRLGKFGLELSPEKTRILSFSKFRMEENNRFNFLGFEFRWGIGRTGKPQIKRRTSPKKFKKSVKNFTEWIKTHRNMKIRELIPKLNRRLKGYYEHYGIIGNSDSLWKFYRQVEKVMKKWLNRRSQRKSYTWEGFREMLKYYPLLKPRITESRNYQLNLFSTYC